MIFALIGTVVAATAAPAVTVLPAGALHCSTSADGTACRGIPYAAPPVGALRFRPPAPPQRWRGVRDATRFASACLQAATAYDPAQGAEDCLYLNVYRPPAARSAGALPVIVWLHGGGFMNGSGNAFDGTRLATSANAVVVTVNYRLGPFGWLALPSLAAETPDGTTGNYGLLDSIAALQWVKRNIAALGGDPARVTVAGQSAGGEQVLALLSSDAATGLFSRAISMSAPTSLPLATTVQSAARRGDFLAKLGCTDVATQATCLRKVGAATMLAAADESWDLLRVPGFLRWTPTLDGAVLKAQWVDRYRAGRAPRSPVMIGHTADEGALFTAIYQNVQGSPMTDAEVAGEIERIFKDKAAAVAAAYPATRFPTPRARMDAIMVDALFAEGETLDRAALAAFQPVYGYRFADPQAPESHVHSRFDPIGSGHDSDLAYLFQWDDFAGRRPALDADQRRLAETIGQYWGRFAATGDPNGPGLPVWPTAGAGGDTVQLLETSAQGGVRTAAPGSYRRDHQLELWEAAGR
jgi:para-nitrobenzyl esterase